MERTYRAVRTTFATFLTVFALLAASDARADVCTAAMTDISFGNVSPVSGQDYFASGTLSVTCTFVILIGNIIVLPNINGCANLGPGSGASDVNARVLNVGGVNIPFNLYRSATYTPANIWGSYVNSMSISTQFAGLLAVGTNTQTYPVYAKIAASDLAAAALISNNTTTYSASFAGAGVLNYASSSIVFLACQGSGQTAAYSFNVSANVISDCLITASPLAFNASGILNAPIRATSTLAVKCTAANSYRIALNGGSVTNAPAGRKMKNGASSDTVNYRLSSTLDGPIWGDGTAGTLTYDSTGTGLTQQLTIYGMIPAQVTPPPGDYTDHVTATIYF